MNILLTGGLGFIGSTIILKLIEKNYKPIIIDNLSTSKKVSIERIESITKKKLDFYNCDIKNLPDLENIFNKIQVDHVIHLAGLKSVSESMSFPTRYFNNNILGSINLLEMMQRHNIKKIIFSSSATVYGHPNKLPLSENHDLNPVNIYGRTKLIVENMIKDLILSGDLSSGICLRYFNPIGSYKNGLLGEDPRTASDNLIPQILQKISNDSKILNVYGENLDTLDGSAVRDFIHISDLIDGHISSLNFQKKNNGFFDFNLGTGSGNSVLKIIKTFEKIISKKINYNIKLQRPGEIPSYYCDPSKAERYLNWTTKFDINDMCEDSLLWHQKIN